MLAISTLTSPLGAALRFIPVERLEQEGYGQYLSLFQDQDKEEAIE